MRNIIRLSFILCLSMVSVLVSAQDEAAEPGATVLNCANGEGCVRTESSLTVEEVAVVLGENPPEGMESPYVVCADGMGCMWSHVSEDDADLLFGGDGIEDMVFDEDEGLEIITNEDMEFTEDEGTEVDTEEGLIFTEEEIAEFEDMLCNGAADCNWTDFSPEEIDALFPEFEGVAYIIVPREGEWQGTSHPPVLIGCPAGTADALANYTVSETATLAIGENFAVDDLMVIPGAVVSNPVPNVYSVYYSPDETASVQYVYRIVSSEYIVAKMRFNITVPGVMSCTALVDFDFEYIG